MVQRYPPTFAARNGEGIGENDCEALLEKDPEDAKVAAGVVGSVPVDWLMTGACFLFPAFGGLLFGYDIGATSGALLSLTSPETSGTNWYNLTSFESGWVVSSSLAGALLGSGGALAWGDWLGRKKELLLAAVLYGSAAVALGLAPNLVTFVAAHALYGLGIGFAMHAAPAYIAETAPPQVRGVLISLKEAFIVGGILLGYLSSYLLVEALAGWRGMYTAALLPALALGAGMAWLPESPRWLVLTGAGRDVAASALVRVKGRYGDVSAARAEVASIERSLDADGGSGGPQGFQALLQGPNLRPLLVGSSLMLFQQITGQPSVLYYAGKLFQDAGFTGGADAAGVSVLLGLFKLLMTGVAVLSVDVWGRRPLLLTGVTGMALALLTLGAATNQTLLAGTTPALTWTSVAALLLYVGCYQASFGPISWLLAGELFPLGVRGHALAIATLTNFGSNFGVSLVLPTVSESIGLGNMYYIFCAIALLAVASIYFTVPETKGKTLEEIEAMWRTKDGDD